MLEEIARYENEEAEDEEKEGTTRDIKFIITVCFPKLGISSKSINAEISEPEQDYEQTVIELL